MCIVRPPTTNQVFFALLYFVYRFYFLYFLYYIIIIIIYIQYTLNILLVIPGAPFIIGPL